MNKNKFWSMGIMPILAVCIVAFISSCHDDDPNPKLSVDQTTMSFDAADGGKTFKITANKDAGTWTITADKNWIQTTPMQGEKSMDVTVVVKDNTTTEPREGTITIISKDDSRTITITQKAAESLITVDNNNLFFSAKTGDTRSINIKSNISWAIDASTIPSWLRASTTSGNGDAQVTFTTTRDNKTSSPLEATILIKGGNSSVSIDVKQDGGVAKDCKVTPNHVTVLHNGIAFDMAFEKNVVRYLRGYMETSLVGIMSEDEIIATLEENFKRRLVNENEVPDFSDLEPGTSYSIYTLGFNKDGERGDLVRTDIKTKTLQANEPEAWIGDITTDGDYWYWEISKSATCYTYYMMTTENFDDAMSSDVLQAWWIDDAIRNNSISEYVNGGNWYRPLTNWLCAVWTRGIDAKGNFSNVINWNAGSLTDDSSKRNRVKARDQKNKKGDHSGRKLSPNEYKLTVIRKQ